MKKLFYIFICIIALLSCSPTELVTNIEREQGDKMFVPMKGKYSIEQFDSMCIADTLPRDLSEWQFIGYRDYEDRSKICLYLLLKENGKYETMYRVEGIIDDSVKIIKRVIE